LADIEESFLGTRLAFEAVGPGRSPWAAYFRSFPDTVLLVSRFGVPSDAAVPSAATLIAGAERGFLEYNSAVASVAEPAEGHYLVFPQSARLPVQDEAQFRRLASAIPVAVNGLRPPARYSASFPQEIVHIGMSRNYSYASLFVIDAARLIGISSERCPSAEADSVHDEIFGASSAIVNPSGMSASLRRGLCLHAFFSHARGDVELIAAQVLSTLARRLRTSEPKTILVGAVSTLQLSDPGAESAIGSFVDGL